MTRQPPTLAKLYRSALLKHLQQGVPASLKAAHGLGARALTAGLQTLDLAKLHEEILVQEVLPGVGARRRAMLIRRAGVFFGVAITPIEQTHRGVREATAQLKKFVQMLSQRTVELAASNLGLSLEIAQRKVAEAALKKSEQHYTELLRRSDLLQEQLRRLSRQIITAQEDERRKISRELHDVIAQTLTGISIRLATLKKAATTDSQQLERNIARTQRLVEKSVEIVHQFARELRPAVLDDLGLIPALHSFVKAYSQRTKLRVYLKVVTGIERLSINHRTVLYRVIQESLTNVARHAHATEVTVSIQWLAAGLFLKVTDNGKSFRVDDVLHSRGRQRLGLLGMRERVEMIGGQFEIVSAPGQGTSVQVQLRLPKLSAESAEKPPTPQPKAS
jgi:signal transduction histidine kinase